jgi:hypothetical protein
MRKSCADAARHISSVPPGDDENRLLNPRCAAMGTLPALHKRLTRPPYGKEELMNKRERLKIFGRSIMCYLKQKMRQNRDGSNHSLSRFSVQEYRFPPSIPQTAPSFYPQCCWELRQTALTLCKSISICRYIYTSVSAW